MIKDEAGFLHMKEEVVAFGLRTVVERLEAMF